MVKHIIVWNFKEDMSVEEKQSAAAKIKAELEALQGVIEGLIEIKVEVEHLSSSSGELMLDSTFEDEEALKGYQVHPEHVKAAQFVRSVMGNRSCFDYEV